MSGKSTKGGIVSVSDKLRDSVQLAITRASANYPPQQWHELPSSRRTREIYRELRELDAAALRRLQEVTGRVVRGATRKSRSVVET
jgi:hypothetical protein